MSANTKELEIEAPWGKIAVKLWGDENNYAVLVFHGILDNAGSFDRLIPLLPQEYFYICVDLPGHGKSSPFPPHLPIHSVNFMLVFKVVMDYFNREKYIIIAHSYGGQLSYLFCQLSPTRVEKLILFDTFSLAPVVRNKFQTYLTYKFTTFLNIEKKLKTNKTPQYTYEEALERIRKGHLPPISRESAVGILDRMLIPKENGKYELSTDQRLKAYISPLYDDQYMIKLTEQFPVQCPVLIIFASFGSYHTAYLKPLIGFLRSLDNVSIAYVSGYHDVHNEKPDLIAPHVINFLKSKKSKL